MSLVQSTVRIALGFITGERATVLARGVLSSMLVNQLKVVAALVVLALGGGWGMWQAMAGHSKTGVTPLRDQWPTRPRPIRRRWPRRPKPGSSRPDTD